MSKKTRKMNRVTYSLSDILRIIIVESGGGHPDNYIPQTATIRFEARKATVRIVVEWPE